MTSLEREEMIKQANQRGKEKQLKLSINQFIRIRKNILEEAIRLGMKYAQRLYILHNYMLVDLDDVIIINYFKYTDYPDDENVYSVRFPYEAIIDMEKWINEEINRKEKEEDFEKILNLKNDLKSLKKERDLIVKQSQSLIEQCEKLEHQLKSLSKKG